MTKPWHGPDAPADPVERLEEIKKTSSYWDALAAYPKMRELVDDLAALCEELSDALATSLSEPGATFDADSVRHDVIMQTRNPDGTRRWPGVGDEAVGQGDKDKR